MFSKNNIKKGYYYLFKQFENDLTLFKESLVKNEELEIDEEKGKKIIEQLSEFFKQNYNVNSKSKKLTKTKKSNYQHLCLNIYSECSENLTLEQKKNIYRFFIILYPIYKKKGDITTLEFKKIVKNIRNKKKEKVEPVNNDLKIIKKSFDQSIDIENLTTKETLKKYYEEISDKYIDYVKQCFYEQYKAMLTIGAYDYESPIAKELNENADKILSNFVESFKEKIHKYAMEMVKEYKNDNDFDEILYGLPDWYREYCWGENNYLKKEILKIMKIEEREEE